MGQQLGGGAVNRNSAVGFGKTDHETAALRPALLRCDPSCKPALLPDIEGHQMRV